MAIFDGLRVTCVWGVVCLNGLTVWKCASVSGVCGPSDGLPVIPAGCGAIVRRLASFKPADHHQKARSDVYHLPDRKNQQKNDADLKVSFFQTGRFYVFGFQNEKNRCTSRARM